MLKNTIYIKFSLKNMHFRIYFNMKKEYILVIDSGVGGLSTLAEIIKILPANYLYVADNQHHPYGKHSGSQIIEYVASIIDKAHKKYHIKMVVLACNTATAAAINVLRIRYKSITFIGSEPAIRLAEVMGFGKILSLTTPATAKQNKYIMLSKSIKADIKTCGLPHLASIIEQNLTNPTILNALRQKIELFFIKNLSKNYDCIVLGCTHYALIKPKMSEILQKPIIDGNHAIAKQVFLTFKTKGCFSPAEATVDFLFTKPSYGYKQIYKKILSQILAK